MRNQASASGESIELAAASSVDLSAARTLVDENSGRPGPRSTCAGTGVGSAASSSLDASSEASGERKGTKRRAPPAGRFHFLSRELYSYILRVQGDEADNFSFGDEPEVTRGKGSIY